VRGPGKGEHVGFRAENVWKRKDLVVPRATRVGVEARDGRVWGASFSLTLSLSISGGLTCDSGTGTG